MLSLQDKIIFWLVISGSVGMIISLICGKIFNLPESFTWGCGLLVMCGVVLMFIEGWRSPPRIP